MNPFGASSFRGSPALRESCRAHSSQEDPLDARFAVCLALALVLRRANYVLRVVHSEQSFHFAVRHDAGIRGCLEQLLHIPVSDEWQMATLQFSSGGLGLRNAERLCPTAYWASWADTLPVVRRRHPGIVDHLMLSLLRNTGGFQFGGSKRASDTPPGSWCRRPRVG